MNNTQTARNEQIILRNDFHRTSASVGLGDVMFKNVGRVKQKLCGVSGCVCSGSLGYRGPQDVDIEQLFPQGPDYTQTKPLYRITRRAGVAK